MMRPLTWFLCLLAGVSPLTAEDWPAWRGPRGDGTSRETNLPITFSPTENVRWKTAIPGSGYSSPVVQGDHVFVSSCVEDTGDRLLVCLDRKSGKIRWTRTVLTAPLEKKHGDNSYASSTPACDGARVWVSFLAYPDMVVACYDHEGNKLWQKSPGKLLSKHGFCSSPILHKEMVILNGDQDAEAYLVALDQKTGKEVWRADRPNRTRSYCTPILIPDPRRSGATQMVLSGSKCVTGYDADTGKLLWIHDGPTEQYVASLVPHQGLLFLTTGFPEYHLMGLRADGTGNITGSEHVAWHIPHRDNGSRGASYVPSPLAHDGHFFVVSDVGFLGCIEAKTGKRLWMKKLGNKHYASPVLVQDRMYLPDLSGKVWVIKASPTFDKLAVNEMAEPINASPAVSGGQLLLRTERHLYCIGK